MTTAFLLTISAKYPFLPESERLKGCFDRGWTSADNPETGVSTGPPDLQAQS